MNLRLFKSILFSFFLSLALFLPALADFVPGQIVVKFKPQTSLQTRGNLLTQSPDPRLGEINARYGVTETSRVYPKGTFKKANSLENTYVVKFPKEKPIEEILNAYKDNPLVEYAEPNYLVHAFLTPDDPYFTDGLQWGVQKIQSESGWNITTGTNSTIIAVIDTGVNYNHEDLAGKVILGKNFTVSPSDPAYNNPMDDHYPGHGTACSGVAAAIGNNGIGIAGVNWQAKIMAIKVLDAGGSGTHTDVANGIIYAAEHGADVASMSFGDYSGSDTLRDAINTAYDAGVVLVAAAGNDGSTDLSYPAGYTGKVIAVAATDQTDKRSVWSTYQSSNYGTWITVCAPGTSIYTLQRSSPYYRYMNGTSLATPFVSGLAGLLAGMHPTWGNDDIANQIINTCDNIDAENPRYIGKLGAGRINISKAFNAPFGTISSPANNATIFGNVPITGSATGEGFVSYKIEVGKGSIPATWTLIGSIHSTPVTSSLLETWATLPGENGLHTIRLTVYADSGASSSTILVNVNNPLEVLGDVKVGPVPYSTKTGNPMQIQYEVSTSAHLIFEIFDTTGNLIWRTESDQTPGAHSLSWNGKNLFNQVPPNGAYIYRLYSNQGGTNTALGKGRFLLLN